MFLICFTLSETCGFYFFENFIITVPRPFTPLSNPSPILAGFLFSPSCRFFWYSSSNVRIAKPFPKDPLIRCRAPAVPTMNENVQLKNSIKKGNLTHRIKKHECLYTLFEQFDASPWDLCGYENSDIAEKCKTRVTFSGLRYFVLK